VEYAETPAQHDPVWWSYVSLGVRTVIQIVSSTILARILSPADYGIAAMLGTLLALLTMAAEMGLNWVAVQRARLRLHEVHSLFFFNVSFGFAAGIGCFLMAPLLASFYHKPELEWCARVAALVFPFSALAVQPLALMRRWIRLKKIFYVEAGALFAGGCAGLILALSWRDYRALVVQAPITQAIRAIFALKASGYRPRRPRELRASLSFLADGVWMQMFQVFTQVFRNFDNVIIGEHSGARELGFYARAYYLTTVPSQLTVGTLAESIIPKLSLAWNSGEGFADLYRRYLKAACSLSIPIAVIMAGCAPEFIYFLYGPKWSGVDRLLVIMSLTTALQPLYNSSYWLLTSSGKFRLMALIGTINCAVLLTSFLIGVQGGATGVAAAYGTVMVFLTFIVLAWAHRAVDVDLKTTLRELRWVASTASVLAITLAALRLVASHFAFGPLIRLAVLLTGAGLIYFGAIGVAVLRAFQSGGKPRGEITSHDVILEVRRFFLAR
jgi:PST family polysaccharide transporter